jgi:hypothetical protein
MTREEVDYGMKISSQRRSGTVISAELRFTQAKKFETEASFREQRMAMKRFVIKYR